jgi:hypothetical protein
MFGPMQVWHDYKNSNYKNIQILSHPISSFRFEVVRNQKPCANGFDFVNSKNKKESTPC